MKKNFVAKKHKDMYYSYFLPLLECIFTLKYMHSKDLVVTEQSLATFFKVDRKIISGFFKQAQKDQLLIFDRRVRKFDDEKIKFAINRYTLPISENDDYYSKLQEFINEYMLWQPTYDERIDFYYSYLAEVDKIDHSVKNLEKEERAKKYFTRYSWTKEIMDRINENRPQKLKSSYLSDGKLRENNFLCTTLNPEKEHEMRLLATDLNYRYNVLTDYFGTEDFIECDTNASIYRLSYNLNHEKLLSHDIDIYQKFWQLAGFSIEMDHTCREHLKVLCMPIFMSNGAKNGYNALLTLKDDMELSKSEHNRKLILNQLSAKLGLDARTILDRLTEAMYEFIGTDHFLESEIFIYESNLHLLILDECLKQNIQAINVYDGFYFKRSDMDQKKYSKMYDDCTKLLKTIK